MIVLSYGMRKSASTFVFQLTQLAIAEHCRVTGQKMLTLGEVYPESPYENFLLEDVPLYEALEVIEGRIDRKQWLVIKTHHKADLRVISEGTFVTASYRHPQEQALSIVDASRVDSTFESYSTIEKTVPLIRGDIAAFSFWSDSAYRVFFDDAVKDPMHVADGLTEYLGIYPLPSCILDSLIDNKAANVIAFNIGILDRHLEEFPDEFKPLFEREFGDFQRMCDAAKRHRR